MTDLKEFNEEQRSKLTKWSDQLIIGGIKSMALDKTGKKVTSGDKQKWSEMTHSNFKPTDEVKFVVCGEKSGIIVVDFDTLEQYTNLTMNILHDADQYPTVKTHKGVHLYFQYTDKLLQPDKKILNVDILGNGKRVYFADTKYKLQNGEYFTYKWLFAETLKPIPDNLLDHINGLSKKPKTPKKSSTPPLNINDISLNAFDNDNESIEQIKKYCDLIDVKYINDRETWLPLVFAQKRCGVDLSYCHQWSLKGQDCKILLDDEFDKTWNSEDNREGGSSIGTIKYYAKLSNIKAYEEIRDKKLEKKLNEVIKKCTEFGIAELFDILCGDKIVYVKDENQFYTWCNNKWNKEDLKTGNFAKLLISTELCYYFETSIKNMNDKYDKYESSDDLEFVRRTRETKMSEIIIHLKTTSWKTNLWKEIIALNMIKNHNIKFDNNPNLLGFDGGKKLNVMTREWSDIVYNDYITMSTGYEYIEPTQEQTDIMKDLFSKAFPNVEIRRCFLSILFNSLIGGQKEKFIIARGGGGNAKGVMIELTQLMLGEYAYTAPITLLTRDIKSGANPEVANFHRKRFVLMKEPSATDKLNLSNIKQFTGNSSICARGLYSSETKIKLECTLLLETNPSLRFNGKAGDAEIRRFLEIYFESTFTDDKDKLNDKTQSNVFEKNIYYTTSDFREEYKYALLKYIIDNADKTIYEPDCVKERTRSYIDDQDTFNIWIKENYKFTDSVDDIIKVKDMYNLYKESDEYQNTERNNRPNQNRFKLDYVMSDKILKNKYKDRYQPYVNGVQKEYTNIILGIKQTFEEDDDFD